MFFLRYTEEETTAAGKPAATGPAALSSAQRELSDGTDETLRDITLVLLCAFKGSTSFQRVTFIIEKFTELIKKKKIYFTGQSRKFFWRRVEPDELSTWALRLVSSGLHSFYRKQSLMRDGRRNSLLSAKWS